MSFYFEFATVAYDTYQGGGILMTLFWLVVIVLWAINHHKTNETIKQIINYTGLVMLIAMFPPAVKIIADYCVGREAYWRIFWLLPEVIVLAYFFTQITVRSHGIKRAVIVVLACVMLLSTSDTFLETVQIDESKGTLDISNTVVALCDYLHTAADDYGEDTIMAIFPDEMLTSVRQYDATIYMPYGRPRNNQIYDIMQTTPLDASELVYWAKHYACNYLIYPVSSDGQAEEDLIEAGYEKLTSIDGYNVYHLDLQE